MTLVYIGLLQFIYIIFSTFDANTLLEARGAFLDKAFDRVWNNSPLYKLKGNEIDSNFFKLIKSF